MLTQKYVKNDDLFSLMTNLTHWYHFMAYYKELFRSNQ